MQINYSNNKFRQDPCWEKPFVKGSCYSEKKSSSSSSFPALFGSVTRFSFDGAGDCAPFDYSGCGGTGNNFVTREDCVRVCLDSPCQDPPFQAGPCEAAHRRFAFDGERCRPFTYGGCCGNRNNFANRRECEQICVNRMPCKNRFSN